jgi:hypothetical protein
MAACDAIDLLGRHFTYFPLCFLNEMFLYSSCVKGTSRCQKCINCVFPPRLVTLENSPCVTPELLRIFQNMSPLLGMSSDLTEMFVNVTAA